MKDIFLVIGSILTVVSVIPYVRDILRGVTRPNLVSWITWTILTGIATIAEIAAHEYVTALFTSAAVAETLIVVVVGLACHAYVRYTKFDTICQILALVGIVLWQLFHTPLIAILGALLIDFIGALPTIRHAWQRPGEETWQTYAVCFIGAAFGLMALGHYSTASLAYPIYLMLVNLVTTAVILARRQGSQ